MISFPLPAALETLLLEQQLADAGLRTGAYVSGGSLVLGNLGEPERDEAAAVIDAHVTAAQAAANQAATERTNETSIRDKAAQALTANTTDIGTNDSFLAIASPTNAQVAAQVKELTRQSTRQARELNALIRLVLRRFESAD